MKGKYTKIPNTLHLSIHSVDLKQNVSGLFDIHWARGEHKGQTDKIPCGPDFKIPFEANFEIPCTIFIQKDYQSIRSKLLKITLKRYQDQKLPKVYGKLTLDLAKYYTREIELQARDPRNSIEPIKESIEMETGRAVAPVITTTFTFIQNGAIDVTEVDQNDISFVGDTKDKMKTNLDEWDVTEVSSENSTSKHSKSKRKHSTNPDKDLDDLDDSKSKKKHKKSKKKKDQDNNESESKSEKSDQPTEIKSAYDKFLESPILDSANVVMFEKESKSEPSIQATEDTKDESTQATNDSQQSSEPNQPLPAESSHQNASTETTEQNNMNDLSDQTNSNDLSDGSENNRRISLGSEDTTDDQLVTDSGDDQPPSPKAKTRKRRKSKVKRRSTSSNPDLLFDSKSSFTDDQSESETSGIVFQRETPNYNDLIAQIIQRQWSQSKKPSYLDDNKQVMYPPCVFPLYSTLLFSHALFAMVQSDNNKNLELIDHFVTCYENSNITENLTINQNLLTPLCLVLLAVYLKGVELLHLDGKYEDNSKYFLVKMNALVEKGIDMFLSPLLHKFDPLINRFVTAKFEMDCLLVDFKQVYKSIQKYFVFTSGINRMLMLMLLEKLELRISAKLLSQPSRFLFSNAILWNSFISAFISDERIELETLREIISVLIMANGISEDPTMKNEIAPHTEPKIVLFIMKNYHPDVMMPQIINSDKFIQAFFGDSEIDQQELNEGINESAPKIEESLTIDKYREIAIDGVNLDNWNHIEASNIMNNLYPWMKNFVSQD